MRVTADAAAASALVCVLLSAACGPKTVPLPVVTTPKYVDFIAPTVPPDLARTPAALNENRGWQFLQAGDLKNAEREFSTAVRLMPAFYPADAALGYVELARKDAKAALPHFDRVLEREPADVSALVGRGQALIALNREADALAAFEAAVAADPYLVDLNRRIEVLKFRGVERGLTNARAAARAGRSDEAIAAFRRAIVSSPDSAFLYREVAGIERQHGDADAALADFRKALALEPTDAKSLVQIGEILEGRNDLEGAAKAYTDSLAIEPSAEVEARLDRLRERAALAMLPDEYRAIDRLPQVTRAEIAALVGIRLAPLLQAGRNRDSVLITDLRNTWAATWIMAVARAGIMEPFANHAFQPRTLVRRTDLAQVAGRLLARIAAINPARGRTWQAARGTFSDLSAGHLAYPAASAAVAAGVMTLGPDNSFQPSRAVSGAEAIDVIDRIGALAAPVVGGKGKAER